MVVDVLTCITTRRTAASFNDVAPSVEHVRQIIEAACCAPDHKLMRPWRFVTVRDEQRAKVVNALDAAADRITAAGGRARRQSHKPMRARVFVVVIAAVDESGPAPRSEQIASADSAVYAICLAAHGLGLASAWRSVPFAAAPEVRELFGVRPGEELVGWVDLGYDGGGELKVRPPVDVASLVSELT